MGCSLHLSTMTPIFPELPPVSSETSTTKQQNSSNRLEIKLVGRNRSGLVDNTSETLSFPQGTIMPPQQIFQGRFRPPKLKKTNNQQMQNNPDEAGGDGSFWHTA